MRQQAAKGEADFGNVDAVLGTARYAAAQDMHRQRDHDALMPWQLRHGINGSRAT